MTQAREKKATDAPRLRRGTSSTAHRQRAFHSAKDYEQSASQIGPVVAPEASERRKASLVVADQVTKGKLPKDEVVELLMMLGIHPDQPDWDDGPVTGPGAIPKGM